MVPLKMNPKKVLKSILYNTQKIPTDILYIGTLILAFVRKVVRRTTKGISEYLKNQACTRQTDILLYKENL